jgi:hypothetical protein
MWPKGPERVRPPGSSGSTRIPSRGTSDGPAGTPATGTTRSWLFPPTTTEVPFDETWGFVGRKEKNCDPDDRRRGDGWDQVALDPESRLVVRLVVGKRTEDATQTLVRDFHRRTGGRVMRRMTSDEYPAYAAAIRDTSGPVVTPPRPRQPHTVVPPAVTYATVHKERENNRMVGVSTRVVFGTAAAVALGLLASAVSTAVNRLVAQ